MPFALWIERGCPDGERWLVRSHCELFCSTDHMTPGSFSGPAFMCSTGKRERLSVFIARGLAEGVGEVFAVTMTPSPASLERILLTDDPALRNIYSGTARFQPSPAAAALIADKRTNLLAIYSQDWCGVLERDARTFRTRRHPQWRLWAFSASPRVIESGPVHFRPDPAYADLLPSRAAGRIEIEK